MQLGLLVNTRVWFWFEAVLVLEIWEFSHFRAVESWSLNVELENFIVEVVDLLRVDIWAIRWEFTWLFVEIDLQMSKLLLYSLGFFIVKQHIDIFMVDFLLLFVWVILTLWCIWWLSFVKSFDTWVLLAWEDWSYFQGVLFLWWSIWI